MPRAVVSMNPWGVLGPGESQRAIIPATKPIRIIQRMLMPAPICHSGSNQRMKLYRSIVHRRAHASKQALSLLVGRQPPVRRQLIDHLRQILTEAAKQFVARHPCLLDEGVDLVRAERAAQIVGRYLLVGSGANPRIDGFTVSALLELFEQIVQATTKDGSRGASGQ